MEKRAEPVYKGQHGSSKPENTLHVALAEATADFFITCDDRLLRKCKRERVAIIAMNPVEFTITEDLK